MSTLEIDSITNLAGTKSAPTDDLVDGRCTAWVNFNGAGAVAIRSSFNVSSITDNGVGYYRVNFTTPMANSSYVMVSNVGVNTSSDAQSTFERWQARTARFCAIYTGIATATITNTAPSWVRASQRSNYDVTTVSRTASDAAAVQVAIFGGK